MAAAPLFDHFEQPEVRAAFDEYLKELRLAGLPDGAISEFALRGERRGLRGEAEKKSYDGALLYEGRVHAAVKEHLPATRHRAAKRAVSEAVRKLLKALVYKNGEPHPYYAMLMADGDRMGPLINQQQGAEEHREFSKALEGFARKAREIVEKDHGGSLIYSGGDDVLALLPLDRAVACGRALAEDFSQRLGSFASKEHPPTLSVGIAIAHHIVHFAHVRELAREAEWLAKTRRDALAIIIDRRSGGRREILGPWKSNRDKSQRQPLDERLARWRKMLADDKLSRGMIHEVERLTRFADARIGTQDHAVSRELGHMVEHELERVMDRKEPGTKTSGLDEDVKATLRCYVRRSKEQDIALGLRQLSSELYVALELERVAQLKRPSSAPDDARGGQ